jgi:hypothetical protein
MAYPGITRTNGLDKSAMERPLGPRWWHDMRTAYSAIATVVALAMAFWHFGGSTLFTFQTRLAVVEERSTLGAAVEGVRTQLLGQVSEVRSSVTRVEAKIDAASAAAGEASRKVDQVLSKLDTMTGTPVAEVAPRKPLRAPQTAKPAKAVVEKPKPHSWLAGLVSGR